MPLAAPSSARPGPALPAAMERAAVFDPGGRYRYALTRRWAAGGATVVFVLLNPSTADAERDDPTLRRCIGFAMDWGFAAVEVVNLFAWRATRPADLRRVARPVGPKNDGHILRAASAAACVVLAWGNHGALGGRDVVVLRRLADLGIVLNCLGLTLSGQPRHVLYLPRTAARRVYPGSAIRSTPDPHTGTRSGTVHRPARR